VFSVPSNDLVLTNRFRDVSARDATELGRFVLLDDVPGNGESWFIARCFERLRRNGLAGVLSMSDPEPRSTLDGRTIFAGHIGTIYQATNGLYQGRSDSKTRLLFPDGTILSQRALPKVRAYARGDLVRGKGWTTAVKQLVKHGAEAPPADRDELIKWLDRWAAQLTRRVRHPGNHVYCWALQRTAGKSLRRLPYPRPHPMLWN
jgi:hypothetical protein